jgi:hypothetical protein
MPSSSLLHGWFPFRVSIPPYLWIPYLLAIFRLHLWLWLWASAHLRTIQNFIIICLQTPSSLHYTSILELLWPVASMQVVLMCLFICPPACGWVSPCTIQFLNTSFFDPSAIHSCGHANQVVVSCTLLPYLLCCVHQNHRIHINSSALVRLRSFSIPSSDYVLLWTWS